MFCRKCGAALPDGSAFCPKCGTPVSGAAGGTGGNNSGPRAAGGCRFSLLSLRGWFSGNGRMPRQEFWIRDLILICNGDLLGYLLWRVPDNTESYSGGAQAAIIAAGIAAVAVGLAMMVSAYFIFVRRLHDMSVSGYVVIPVMVIDLIALVVDIQFGDDSSFFGVQDLTNLIELVILGSIPGTYWQNRFGSEPKG